MPANPEGHVEASTLRDYVEGLRRFFAIKRQLSARRRIFSAHSCIERSRLATRLIRLAIPWPAVFVATCLCCKSLSLLTTNNPELRFLAPRSSMSIVNLLCPGNAYLIDIIVLRVTVHVSFFDPRRHIRINRSVLLLSSRPINP